MFIVTVTAALDVLGCLNDINRFPMFCVTETPARKPNMIALTRPEKGPI